MDRTIESQTDMDALTLIDAMKVACELVGVRDMRMYDVVAAAGVDASLAMIAGTTGRGTWSKWGASFTRELRSSFSLGTYLTIDLGNEMGAPGWQHRVCVEIKWSSGGGSPGVALGVLTHHMDMLKKAAQAEVVLVDAVRTVRTKERFEAAMERASVIAAETVVAAGAAVQAHLNAKRAVTP